VHFQCRVGTIGRQSFAIQHLQQVQLPPLLARVQTAVVAERKGNIIQGARALAVAHAAIPNSCAVAEPHKAKAASEHLQDGLGLVADVGVANVQHAQLVSIACEVGK